MGRYRAGICNIGMKNRFGRLAFGLFFFSAGVWGWAFIMINSMPFITKLFLFVPFYLGFLGIFEAIFGFCVILARNKVYDMR